MVSLLFVYILVFSKLTLSDLKLTYSRLVQFQVFSFHVICNQCAPVIYVIMIKKCILHECYRLLSQLCIIKTKNIAGNSACIVLQQRPCVAITYCRYLGNILEKSSLRVYVKIFLCFDSLFIASLNSDFFQITFCTVFINTFFQDY